MKTTLIITFIISIILICIAYQIGVKRGGENATFVDSDIKKYLDEHGTI